MKALVEPFPLVPAMCIGFKRSNSEGYIVSQRSIRANRAGTGAAHLISNLATPLNHFRDSLFVHSLSRFPNCIYNGKIGLQRVERLHGGLRTVSAFVQSARSKRIAYCVVTFRHDGEAVMEADDWNDSTRTKLPCYPRHQDMAGIVFRRVAALFQVMLIAADNRAGRWVHGPR